MPYSRGGSFVRLGTSFVLLTLSLHAHAILEYALPTAQQVVHGPQVPITLRFNSRIDGKRSRIVLTTPDGGTATVPIKEQTAPDTLNAQAEGLKSGSYIIRWQVLANDGHITRGEVPFRVQ